MAGVEGRFRRWCGVLAVALIVFVGYIVALHWLGVTGWLRLVAILVFSIPLRICVQAFLAGGGRGPGAEQQEG